MKVASLKEIRQELEQISHAELVQLSLQLIKFKKESKELASYILFESANEHEYVQAIQQEIDLLLAEVNTKNLYIAKKNIRKIVRLANRYIKYSKEPTTEIEALLHLSKGLKKLAIDYKKSVQLQKIKESLLTKIQKAIAALHEDLQYDYLKALKSVD